MLGDGSDLRVLLMTRGGGSVIAELNPVSGSFDRQIDATSSLTLDATINGKLDISCCDDYEEMYQWATEIAVFRDGRDAWAGPVTDIIFTYGGVKVQASDLSAWWDRRVLPASFYSNLDLSTIFQNYHDQAMEQDSSPNFTVSAEPSGIIGSRTVNDSDAAYARDKLEELATTGVDWTAYGRTIIVSGQEIPVAPYVTLLDEHFDNPPSVHARGDDQANDIIIKGAGVTARATDSDYVAFYGLLTRRFNEPSIRDQESADTAARTRLEFLKDPVYIETPAASSLKTTAPITLPELIPGIRVRVDSNSTCRQVARDFRLESVKVDFSGKVSITLQPLGSVDIRALAQAG